MWSYTVDASLVKSSMKYPLCSFCGFLGVLVEQKNKGMHCIGDRRHTFLICVVCLSYMMNNVAITVISFKQTNEFGSILIMSVQNKSITGRHRPIYAIALLLLPVKMDRIGKL